MLFIFILDLEYQFLFSKPSSLSLVYTVVREKMGLIFLLRKWIYEEVGDLNFTKSWNFFGRVFCEKITQ